MMRCEISGVSGSAGWAAVSSFFSALFDLFLAAAALPVLGAAAAEAPVFSCAGVAVFCAITGCAAKRPRRKIFKKKPLNQAKSTTLSKNTSPRLSHMRREAQVQEISLISGWDALDAFMEPERKPSVSSVT